MYRVDAGRMRHRIAPISRGFSAEGGMVPFGGSTCHSAIRVMPWQGSSIDSRKKTGGYAIGSVRDVKRMKPGIRSSVSGTSSTLAGRGGREHDFVVGGCCCSVG